MDIMAQSCQVARPDSFVFTKPNEWPKWIRRFERYRLASGLDGKPDAMQVNALVYTMGDEASDIMAGFGLTEEEREVYQTVKTKFYEHFVVRRNTIFELHRKLLFSLIKYSNNNHQSSSFKIH